MPVQSRMLSSDIGGECPGGPLVKLEDSIRVEVNLSWNSLAHFCEKIGKPFLTVLDLRPSESSLAIRLTEQKCESLFFDQTHTVAERKAEEKDGKVPQHLVASEKREISLLSRAPGTTPM